MKKLILLAALAALSAPAIAQKNKKAAKNTKPATAAVQPAETQEDAEAMRAMNENRMITPMHHRLMQMTGSWREETKIWSHPGAEPAVTLSVRDGKPLMEGRFVEFNMIGDGKAGHYEAKSVIGWDNMRHIYIKTWFDNMSPGIMVLEGVMDEAKNTIEFKGTVTDPRTRQPVPVRQVLNMNNPQMHILEVYMDFKGKEFKAMEIKSTRS